MNLGLLFHVRHPEGKPSRDWELGINGGRMKRMGVDPAESASVNASVCTVAVDDYDDMHGKFLAAGGTVALPKNALLVTRSDITSPDGLAFCISSYSNRDEHPRAEHCLCGKRVESAKTRRIEGLRVAERLGLFGPGCTAGTFLI